MSDTPLVTALFSEVKVLIETSRQRVALSVNAELTQLYWQVEQAIQREVLRGSRGEYGKQVVPGLAAALTQEFGKGWGSRHLHSDGGGVS